jgi:opacity protein-like surface antigen
MKKIAIVLFLICFTAKAYSQAGDLYVGAQGGYETKYKNLLYGLNLSYNVSDPIQISLTGLMNPNILHKAEYNWDKDETIRLYSASLDVRLFLINMDSWATGPSVGAQYLNLNYPDNDLRNYHAWGANLGWHVKANVTDNLQLNGGWRYTTATEGASYHLFYLGVGYTFNLF